MQRLLPCLIALAASGCAASANAPSLAPRAAEAIDPRVPVAAGPPAAPADAALVETLRDLVAQALAGDEAFQSAIAEARRLAASAGRKESESWVLAQQALSVAVGARAPVTRAMAEVDSLAAMQIQSRGGIGAANLQSIDSAAKQVASIDDREASAIAELQSALRR